MNKIIFFIVTFFLAISFGCKKEWLDEKTSISLAVPSTLQDFQAMLDNAAGIGGVMNINCPNIGEIASDAYSITDASYQLPRPDNEKDVYTWSKQYPNTANPNWGSSYGKVFYANLVLEGLIKVIPSDANEQKQYNDIKGQALFQRAKTFFEVAQIFAPPFSADVESSNLGIPLRLNSDVHAVSVRSTVKQTYDQIVSDLLLARSLLPNTPVFKTRGSVPAVFAMLARTYLSMEKYAEAGKYADSCIQLYSQLLNYNTDIANVSATSATNPITILNKEVIFHSAMISSAIIGSQALLDTAIYNSYSTNDLRRKSLYKLNTNGTVNFKGSYDGTTSTNFNGLASDEVYLIRAECFARANDTASAMRDLNTLLVNRWATGLFANVSCTSAEDGLRKILNERKKELIFRGLRWSDLRRLNRDDRFKVTITRTVLSQVYTLQPASYKYTLPIPDDVIQISGMQQNPGWQ